MKKILILTFLISFILFAKVDAKHSSHSLQTKVAPVIVEITDLKNNKTEILVLEEEVPVIVLFKSEPISRYKPKVKITDKLLYPTLTNEKIKKIKIKKYKEKLKSEHRKLGKPIKREYFYLINGISTKIKRKEIKKIESLPYVEKVYIQKNLTILLQDSVPLINADEVWKEIDAQGYNVTGRGIKVAIIDSGIDYTHPDLGNCTTEEFLNGQCEKVIYGYDFYNDDPDPMDDHGHGTHCAGIVAANGSLKGVAPDAKLLAYKVCSSGGSCPTDDILAAIENATLYGADVISISLGGSGYADNPFTEAIENAIANGTVVVIAAGNSGPGYDTIEAPGATIKAITVGASDKNDQIASFSSRGFSYFSNGSIAGIKPDVLAPGVDINSTVPTGDCSLCDPSGYRLASGTSMATPHVAGVVALLKQAHPDWSPEIIKAAIMNPALDLGYDPLTQGSGRVDAFKSYNITGVVVEGSLCFLDIEDDDKVWSGAKSLNLTNLVGYNNFTITASITQKGINANTSKNWINLTDKLSEKFNLTVEVNNTEVDDGIYFGVVTLNANSSLRVPFAIMKAKILRVYFGEDFWFSYFLKVVNGSYNKSILARNGTNYVEKGEYHIYSVFNGCPPWIPEDCLSHERTYIFAYVNLTTNATFYINKSMAKYKWNYSIYDTNGNELVSQVYPEGEFGYNYQCRLSPWYNHTCASGWIVKFTFNNSWSSTQFSSGTIAPLFFNDANASYWSFFDVHTVGVPSPPSFYIARFAERGVSSNKTLVANKWANLTVEYEFPPNVNVGDMYRGGNIVRAYGANWVGSVSAIGNRIIGTNDSAYKNYEIFYIVPNSEFDAFSQAERAGDFFWLRLYNGTLDYQRICDDCPLLLESPFIEAKNETLFIHRLFLWYIPEMDSNYTMENNIYRIFQSPSWWDGRFDNDPTLITVYARDSDTFFFFRKQSNAAPYLIKNITYDLINASGYVLIANRTLNATYLKISVEPGLYTMKFYWNLDWIGSNWSWSIVNATFNTSSSDSEPPYIEFLRIVQDLTLRNILRNDSEIKIIWKIYDKSNSWTKLPISWQKIYYKKHSDKSWTELPISSENDYNVTTFIISEPGYYDLKIEASDPSGNTITQVQSPSFEVVEDLPPIWIESTNSTNSTIAGTPVEHRLKWKDDFGLSGFIFSFDNCTGYFVNDTWIPFPNGGTQDWSNVTKIINNTIGCIIRWRIYVNNTFNWWNVSETFSYTTISPAPTIGKITLFNSSYFEKQTFNGGDLLIVRTNITDPNGPSNLDYVLITIITPSGKIIIKNDTMYNVTLITNGYTYEYNFTINVSYPGAWTINIYAYDKDGHFAGPNTTEFSETNNITNCVYIEKNYETYYIIKDILVDSTMEVCLNLSANDIVLDCKNHLINGNNKAYYPIFANRSSEEITNITLKNCKIRGGVTNNLYFENSDNNFIENVTAKNALNRYGLEFHNSSNNKIENLTVVNANGYIKFLYSNNNTLTGLDCSGAKENGIFLLSSSYNKIANSTISTSVSPGTYGVSIDGNYNILEGLYIHDIISGVGIEIWVGNHTIVKNVTIDNCAECILIYGWNNTIINSKINQYPNPEITPFGIKISSGGNNTIYNNLINSTEKVIFSEIYPNYWNATKQLGDRIYTSGNYIGGNYWTNSSGDGYSDTCEDSDNDGFCDYAYDVLNDGPCTPGVNCSNNTDYLPLTFIREYNPPLYSNPQASIPSTYSQIKSSFNITWIDDTLISLVYFESNISGSPKNYTMTKISDNIYNFQIISPAGNFYWKSYAKDPSGNWNSTPIYTFTINKATPSLSISGTGTYTYPYTSTVQGTENNLGDDDISYNLYRNGTLVSNPEVIELPAGIYNYIFNSTEGQNYTSHSISSLLIINKAPVNVDIYFSGNGTTVKNQDYWIREDMELNVTACTNISKTWQISSNNFKLWRNGTEVGSIYSNKCITYLAYLSPGTYYFNSSFLGNQNYTSFTRDPYVYVYEKPISVAPSPPKGKAPPAPAPKPVEKISPTLIIGIIIVVIIVVLLLIIL